MYQGLGPALPVGRGAMIECFHRWPVKQCYRYFGWANISPAQIISEVKLARLTQPTADGRNSACRRDLMQICIKPLLFATAFATQLGIAAFSICQGGDMTPVKLYKYDAEEYPQQHCLV